MKKLLICVLALVMIVGACSFGVLAANRYGDIYKDNTINEKDAVKLAQYLAKWNGIVLGTTNNSVSSDAPTTEETEPPVVVVPPVETEDDGWGDIVRP